MRSILRFLKDTRGVSVIIGSMLLIIIVVTGAVAVAAIVTSLQEQAAEKASHKAAVEREELEMLKISLYKEATIDDFEGVYEIASGKPGTEIGYRVLNLTPKWENHSCNIDLGTPCPEAPGNYSLKVTGSSGDTITKTFDEPFEPGYVSFWIKSNVSGNVANISVNDEENISIVTDNEWQKNTTQFISSEFNTIEFILQNDATIWLDDIKYNNPHYWGECEITIRNLNIDDCTLKELAINGLFVRNYSVYTKRSDIWKKETFTSRYPYNIPAQGTVPIRINFLKDFGDPWEIRADQPVPIDVLAITDPGNNFIEVFAPPVTIADVKIETEDIGVAYRDVLILDASESYDPDGFITEYKWSIYYNDSSVNSIMEHTEKGKKIRADLTNLTGIEIDPIRIDLKVTDDTGMVSRLSQISGNITIPSDKNFNPPVKLQADNTTYEYEGTTDKRICVWANDTRNNPVGSVPIRFTVVSGIIILNPWTGATEPNGPACVNVTDVEENGMIRIDSGKLVPVHVNVINTTS